MNIAVHGLDVEIKCGGHVNKYYDNPGAATGRLDLVPAIVGGKGLLGEVELPQT